MHRLASYLELTWLTLLFLASAPPGRCTGTSVISMTATDITVEWKRPNLTGREDIYYSVYYRELKDLYGITSNPYYVNNSDYVDYTIDGLVPSTQYLIKITVHNGVSDQDMENDIFRMCETVASTADIGRFSISNNISQ